MLELYQFPHSAFCLKVRMALNAKGLNYQVINITPGIGQIDIFRRSGQRQVPMLIDGANVITDSSSIIRYIDSKRTKPPLISNDPKQAAQTHIIEDWADTTLAKAVQSALLQATSIDSDLKSSLIPEEWPQPMKQILNALPLGPLNNFTSFLIQKEISDVLISLEKLSILLESNPWIVGENMSFADLAVAAQLSLLKFPISSGSLLANKGCPGFRDNPKLKGLFNWRDHIELLLIKDFPQNT